MAAQQCLRCGTPYLPGDSVCFTCGAPIGEGKSTTQPVAVPKVRPPTPSHPAGMAISAAAPAVRPTATGRQPAVPAPRRRRIWPLALVGVVLAALLAAGLGMVVRASLAGPPIAHLTLYRDSVHHFSFQRPALWSVTTESDGVLLSDSADPSAVASTLRVSVALPAAGEDAATHARTLASQLGLGSAATRQFAGATWEQRIGQVTGTDGAVRQVFVLVTLYDGQLYTIQCASPITSFDATNSLVYQPLLASFAFN